MRKSTQRALASAALFGLMAGPAMSSGFMDSLKSQATSSMGVSESALGALGLPSIGGGTASNVAGVLQYCVKSKYLSASSATSMKDQLLSKAGLGTAQAQKANTSYQQGLTGLLSGSDGTSLDLSKIKDNVKEKACNYVLENASSLL